MKKKKIKKIFIKRKQEVKSNLDLEVDFLSRDETIKRSLYLAGVILLYFIVKLTLFQPPQILVDSFIEDYNSKKDILTTSEPLKMVLNKNIIRADNELKNLKSSFFNLDKSYEFFALIANTAMINQLKILSMKKIKEETYKIPKEGADPDAKEIEYDVYPQYVQSNFHINFEGKFFDYMNFISDIKKKNQGLITESSLIKKSENEILNIQSVITINFTKSDE